MFDTMKRAGVFVGVAVTCAACSAGSGPEGSAERTVRRASEGLLPGSCRSVDPFQPWLNNSCSQQSPDGCWCDDLCRGYGDCCADKAVTCESPTQFLGDYPAASFNFWSDEAQGLTHDASNWYLSQNGATPRLIKVPVSVDVGASQPVTQPISIPPLPAQAVASSIPVSLLPRNENIFQYLGRITGCALTSGPQCAAGIQVRNPGYAHVGDPEMYGSFIFVPLSGTPAPAYGQPTPPDPLVAVYRASDMSFVRTSSVCGLKGVNGGVGWVATDPVRKLLYTSDSHVWSQQPVQVCNIIDSNIDIPGASATDRPFLTAAYQTVLYDQNFVPLDLKNMQGGDLSDDGTRLYLSNGCCNDHSGSDYGLREFDVEIAGLGTLLTGSVNGQSSTQFSLPLCADGKSCADEPEGVDYGQVSGAPGMPDSAYLRLVVLNNGLLDAQTMKHYGFAAF